MPVAVPAGRFAAGPAVMPLAFPAFMPLTDFQACSADIFEAAGATISPRNKLVANELDFIINYIQCGCDGEVIAAARSNMSGIRMSSADELGAQL